jgi:hypothetical protein
MTTLAVLLRPAWIKNVGYRYDVLLDGEIIVRQSRDPEHDAARALAAKGFRGRFRTIDFATGQPRMQLDIERAARLRTVERAQGGICVARYQPMSDEQKESFRLHTSSQGGVFDLGTLRTTGQPLKRAGTKTRAASRRVVENA